MDAIFNIFIKLDISTIIYLEDSIYINLRLNNYFFKIINKLDFTLYSCKII